MRTVLFVCTGQYLQKPYGRGSGGRLCQGEQIGRVCGFSRELRRWMACQPPPRLLRPFIDWVLDFRGVRLPLTADMIIKADVVYCMTASHLAAAQALLRRLEGDHTEVSDRIPTAATIR